MTLPLTYLAHEAEYRSLVSSFVAEHIDSASFVEQYFALWKRDCDAQWEHKPDLSSIDPEERRLCAVLNQIFTACDCYWETPVRPPEISGAQLREEVSALAKGHWPEDAA